MLRSLVISFKEHISLIEHSDRHLILGGSLVELTIKQLSPGLMGAIRMLAAEGATEEHLSEVVLQTDGYSALPTFYYYLQKFIDLCVICHTVLLEGRPLATIVPSSRYYKFHSRTVELDKKYVLSRFAYCRKYQGQMVLESPLSYGQIILRDRRSTAIVSELVNPLDCQEICENIPEVSEEAAKLFLSLLLSAGAVSEVTEDGQVQEEENITLAQWSFHDLLFHSRTRLGRHINYYREDTRFLNEVKRPPVVKPKMSSEMIDLYKPDIEELKETDSTFTLVLEQRKTIRSYADKPITDKQLGEFLYRSARVKSIVETENGEQSSRVYPGGGADYELELYLTINKCENIPPGLYHYCPKDHQLCKLANKNKDVETILEAAAEAARQPQDNLQVLITIAARFPRRAWQYEAITYALTLKHVGVLYQTFYLVATAMALAPCGIAYGDSDLFAATVGTDYYAETSVGEFILGSKPTE